MAPSSTWFTAAPGWGWLIVAWFFFGGLAAGCYLLAALIDLFGRPEDRPLARAGYFAVLPCLVVSGIVLIVDLSRPEEDRTHLGRLVDRVAQDDGGGFADVIQRKLTTNLNILTSSIWTLTIPFALGLLIHLARRRSGFLRDLQEDVPGIRPMLAGGLLVAVLGFALNDSGVAVPAMMFAVLLPYLTYVLLRWDPDRP